ncbi:MAG: riboflavin synthase [Saprospiraceae bacterium]
MFSGIIENKGIISNIVEEGKNKHFTIESDISKEVYIDQSIAHNGVCLTVVSLTNTQYSITAIHETLLKTNLGALNIGDEINLERSVLATSRMDGHFVQGHVDTTAECTDITEEDGSWRYFFVVAERFASLLVPKGSICINGVSLTLVDAVAGSFSVAIIPYTYTHTNFRLLNIGDSVNIEFDILGKYIVKYLDQMYQKS